MITFSFEIENFVAHIFQYNNCLIFIATNLNLEWDILFSWFINRNSHNWSASTHTPFQLRFAKEIVTRYRSNSFLSWCNIYISISHKSTTTCCQNKKKTNLSSRAFCYCLIVFTVNFIFAIPFTETSQVKVVIIKITQDKSRLHALLKSRTEM